MIGRLTVAVIFSTLAFHTAAGEPPKAAVVAVAAAEGVVEVISVALDTRTALVRTANGEMLAIHVPPEAHNLDRVRKGDLFKMRYIEAVALALQKGGQPSAGEQRSVELAPRGAKPGGSIVLTKQLTTVVSAVDRANRTISVTGPQQQPLTLKVADEVRSFDEIAAGDSIAVTYTEALALEMVSRVDAK